MAPTFATATDKQLIALIRDAKDRLAVIAPGLSTDVARALAERMSDLPELSLVVVLDADPEVYRLGYGDTEALSVIREASDAHMFDLREQPGVRIGVVISDDQTIVYAPVSRNIEAGSNSTEKPNAIIISGQATDKLAQASGVGEGLQEIGFQGMAPSRVAEMEANLEADPPKPADLTRRLTVFQSEVQFIELTIRNSKFRTRKIKLPQEFQRFSDETLRTNIESKLSIPIDLAKKEKVSISTDKGDKEVEINEADIEEERKQIELTFLHHLKGRGRIILRKDKELLKQQLDRLLEMTTGYREALEKRFQEHKQDFCNSCVSEFLDSFEKHPPDRLTRYRQIDREKCRSYIEWEASRMFDEAVSLGPARYDVVYKEFSIEDLQNEELMGRLSELMKRAFVDPNVLERLFHTTTAYAAKE